MMPDTTDRIEKLQNLLKQKPNDSFALFGLAMEYAARNEFNLAIEYLTKLIEADPNYVAGYYQKAKLHIKLGEKEDAKQVIQAGINKALETGQFHTRDKLQELLNAINS